MTVHPGDELPVLEHTHTLEDSVRYAGASGDFNPLHYDPAVAGEVSPTGGVIAHGMFSMGLAGRLVAGWAGDPARVAALSARFTRPWRTGTAATFGGAVVEVDGGEATVELWGRDEQGERLLKGTARVRLA